MKITHKPVPTLLQYTADTAAGLTTDCTKVSVDNWGTDVATLYINGAVTGKKINPGMAIEFGGYQNAQVKWTYQILFDAAVGATKGVDVVKEDLTLIE